MEKFQFKVKFDEGGEDIHTYDSYLAADNQQMKWVKLAKKNKRIVEVTGVKLIKEGE